ncbi:hypothetical protein [Caldisericum exile]|uniref:Uncharacterized protein n=1 Tax=Caldisericum exile (strain DSM 21853 / NBRC 104410 / AZM16c01) TaxID=511051 RepID=A0A7U6GE34_CALEA|nr:hypothetical protein [Caldisericum exile]BAL80686.1 hypothetical protein CSE_05600 [Caldisericum exile AZM16c01]
MVRRYAKISITIFTVFLLLMSNAVLFPIEEVKGATISLSGSSTVAVNTTTHYTCSVSGYSYDGNLSYSWDPGSYGIVVSSGKISNTTAIDRYENLSLVKGQF